MPDAVYVFEDCIPDGAIDIANIAPGDVLNRAWSFRVNGRWTLQSPLNNSNFDGGNPNPVLDARRIARGYDGVLFTRDGIRLTQVNTWQAQFNPTVQDYNPAGIMQTWGIPMSFTVTLTMTETVVSDRLLKILADNIAWQIDPQAQPDPTFHFRGVIRGRTL